MRRLHVVYIFVCMWVGRGEETLKIYETSLNNSIPQLLPRTVYINIIYIYIYSYVCMYVFTLFVYYYHTVYLYAFVDTSLGRMG